MFDEDDPIPEGYIRVTEVLEPFKKLGHIDPAVLENAANRGKRVHKYCELYAQNMLVEEPDEECIGYVQSYIEWFDNRMDKVINLEERLNHRDLKISGRYDLLCSLKNQLGVCLIDIKTPQAPSLSWSLQTAAYKILLEDIKGIIVDKRICLILDKKGKKAKEVYYDSHDEDRHLYLSALRLYNYFNKKA